MEYTEGECSCKVVSGFLCGNVIEYCPLHKAAPALYEALKKCRTILDTLMMNGHINKHSLIRDASFVSNEALWALNKAEALAKAENK